MPLPIKVELAEGVTLWCCDFREIIPDGVDEIDHIICDPPFEQEAHDARKVLQRPDGSKTGGALPFSGIGEMRDDLLIRAHMKCRGWLLAFCTTEGVAAWRDAIEANKLKYKKPMIWVKPDAMPQFNGQGPSHGHECIVSAWCGPGYSSWNGGGRRGTFTHLCNPPTRNGVHPTEKPIALMVELVSLFSSPQDLICDPFMGTGSTGIAAVKLGRRFLGIEKSRKFFDVACRRIEEVLKQGDLFVTAPELKQGKLEL